MNDTLLVSTFASVNKTNFEDRLTVSMDSLNLIDSILDGTVAVFTMSVSLVDGVPYDAWLSSLNDVIGDDDDEFFGVKRIYVIATAAAIVLILMLLLVYMFVSGCCGCCCECEERKTEHQKKAYSTYVCVCVCVCTCVTHDPFTYRYRHVHIQLRTNEPTAMY